MTKRASRSRPLPKTKPRPWPSEISPSAQRRFTGAGGAGGTIKASPLHAAHLADRFPLLDADRRDREPALLDELQLFELRLGLDRSQAHRLFQRHHRNDIDLHEFSGLVAGIGISRLHDLGDADDPEAFIRVIEESAIADLHRLEIGGGLEVAHAAPKR